MKSRFTKTIYRRLRKLVRRIDREREQQRNGGPAGGVGSRQPFLFAATDCRALEVAYRDPTLYDAFERSQGGDTYHESDDEDDDNEVSLFPKVLQMVGQQREWVF